jgi:uncharacterized protein YggE
VRAAPLLLAGLSIAFALPAAAQPVPAAPGTIEVVGHASSPVTPDQASVQIGVSTRAASPAAALDENSAAARRVTEFARSFGIEPRDIRTSSVMLTPTFRPSREPGGQPQVDGYGAENQVEIRIRDLSRLGEFLRRAVEGGANRIAGLGFSLSDPRNANDDVRRAAMADAFRQGRLLADAAGVKLGPIRQIIFPPHRDGGPRPLQGGALRSMAAAVPIEPGNIEVSADVQVIWAVEQP